MVKKIAKMLDIDHTSFLIKSGYLWKKIDELSDINGCYAELLMQGKWLALKIMRNWVISFV